MAQSALTVTPPSPTPPTNMACTGATPPNVPNFSKATYLNPVSSPPPYFDDAAGGVAGSGPAWTGPATTLPGVMTNTAALASGTTAADTAGGNGFPTGSAGSTTTGTYAGAVNGAVPASTSVAAEAAGTVVVVQKVQGATAADYNPAVFLPYTGAAAPTTAGATGTWQMITCSVLGNFTGTANSPNASHASSLSPATNPTLTTITPTTAVSGAGTTALTAVTGVGFTSQSVVYANGVAIPTVFVSSTTLTATMPKKATAGTWPITVVTGGVVTTTAQTFTWT